MKAKMKNYNKGTVKYEWAYWVTSDFPRRNKRKDGSYYNLCHRISKSVFRGFSYASNEDTTNWVVPFVQDSGSFYFESIWYKVPSSDNPQHPAYGCNNYTTEYEGGDTVFTGGETFVKVTVYNLKNRVIDSDSIWIGRILGKNETNFERVYEYANANEIIAIISHESTSLQFEITNRYPMYEPHWPRYGYPNGYGLMQIDNSPAPTEEQVWNWKSNIDVGKSRFNTSKTTVTDYISTRGATYLDSVFYMNAYQNYNSGTKKYWEWNKKKAKWEESSDKGSNPEYGRQVYYILKNLNNNERYKYD
ncbi:MAG TPA: hypothetical protein PLL26_07140 [Candidatus Dojkabacteria bacterium]|jgi:hypothetical protein|nr:hypothetical protein [Candidatus Dojkabacteria bacterium]